MFGLQNFRGSCWVNAALQALFSCPPLETRYENGTATDKTNPYDVCLETIYKNRGTHGLKEFFECVKTSYLPAGENIGDSHELIVHLLDKMPWLDREFRFETGEQLECLHCKDVQMNKTTTIDLHLTARGETTLLNAIVDMVQPHVIHDRKCEKCNQIGCNKRTLFGSFPNVLMIWSSPLEYSSVLVLNGKKYHLFAVICFNGGHWWTYARKMPPGNPWYRLDDTRVDSFSSKQFPVDTAMRVLLYFLNEN